MTNDAVRDDVARAIARGDGIELDWITDQSNPRWQRYRKLADFALAALSPPPTVGAEEEAPVAWMWTREDGTQSFVSDPDTKRIWEETMKRVLVPVYTRPSPSAVEVKAVAQAMADRRLELINEPLARIWEELAKTAIRSCIASEKGGV
jgi:hypothetical protein